MQINELLAKISKYAYQLDSEGIDPASIAINIHQHFNQDLIENLENFEGFTIQEVRTMVYYEKLLHILLDDKKLTKSEIIAMTRYD